MKKYLFLLLVLVVALSLSVISYAEPARPTLTLQVLLNTSTQNVTYVAKLSPVPPDAHTVPVIDFYTGSPNLTVFPNIPVGSAPIDSTGVAKISFHQASGKYAGGAIWDSQSTVYGKIFSNVVIYNVP